MRIQPSIQYLFIAIAGLILGILGFIDDPINVWAPLIIANLWLSKGR